MASFDDDVDAGNGSGDDFDNEDEEMEDVNDPAQEDDQDQDQGQDDDGEDDEDEDNDDDDNDNDNDDDDDEDREQPESPSQRAGRRGSGQPLSAKDGSSKPAVTFTSPSPHASATRSPGSGGLASFIPPVRQEALTAQSYDIVPTMAAPQGTSINAICATSDMRWVFSGGSDGYVRMFNWVDTANGRVPLTVAQKHPFVDSVMKAGSLITYWENEEPQTDRTPPPKGEDGEAKWLSPVYSLAVQHQAMWLLSGLESGGINLQTCRHQAGSIITTLREHTSAVSVLNLGQDESSLLSGSWDKTILDWDLNVGKVKRSFRGSTQVSAIETRPMSEVMVPEIAELESFSGTFSTNNADRPQLNGLFSNGTERKETKRDEEDALGSPSGSLFGEGDHGSLFGEDNGPVGGGNSFGDDDEDLTRALADGIGDADANAPVETNDTDIGIDDLPTGGPVQPPELPADSQEAANDTDIQNGDATKPQENDGEQQKESENGAADIEMNESQQPNGMITAPPTGETHKSNTSDLPSQSESTFLDSTIDGTIRIWDRRVASPIATIVPYGGTPPWCVGACWSPDGNFIYAGRRNCAVDEYSIHKMSTNRNKPERTFKFQAGSGSVYAVRAMPNGRHLVCASQDILRLYDLSATEASRHRAGPPFNIVPGHRGGVLSAVYVDPTCRFMLSAAGNRGWESTAGTEVLLGYEIGVQDPAGVWHR